MTNDPARSPDAGAHRALTLVLSARLVEERLETELRSIGLSVRKLGILGHVRGEPGISFSELARRSGIRVQSLHPIVQQLMGEGLLETPGSVHQGRAASVRLTPDGERTLAKAHASLAIIDAEVFDAPPWAGLGEALDEVTLTFRRRAEGVDRAEDTAVL